MKVKSLLSLAFLAGLGLNSANAAEQYIIKDGVVADGIEVLKYATAAAGDAVESGATAPDGTTAAKITHQVMYNDVRFYSKAGIDLTKNWNLVIEFYYKGGTMHDTIAGNKWAALNMGLVDDTTGGKYGLDIMLSSSLTVISSTKTQLISGTQSQCTSMLLLVLRLRT
jgi:hypothetical protein